MTFWETYKEALAGKHSSFKGAGKEFTRRFNRILDGLEDVVFPITELVIGIPLTLILLVFWPITCLFIARNKRKR